MGSPEVAVEGGGRRVCSWAWGGELNQRDGAGGARGAWARSWHPVLQEAGEGGRAELGPPCRGWGPHSPRVGCARKSAFMLTKMKAARSQKSDSL